ncbi:MAG: hypothetical protein JWM40_2655 [Frankiales bacterium]|nr:hypothetical protein [Frankiales bacterium]
MVVPPHARNNFDLIRLAAALQVVLYHGTTVFQVHLPRALHVALYSFPGVPIFFVVSGFLITGSLMRRPSVRQYALARVLRIYPGLWLCFAFTVAVALVADAIGPGFLVSASGVSWIVTQLTIAKGTPSELATFGTGTMNDSLWTIVVELQFYVIALGLMKLPARRASISTQRVAVVSAGLLSLVVALLGAGLLDTAGAAHRALYATALPHFWIFAIGACARLWWDGLRRFAGHPVPWLVAAVLWGALVTDHVAGHPLETAVQAPVEMLLLAMVVFGLAYASPQVAWRMLRGVDVSYGLYLYHFVIINCLLEWQAAGSSGWAATFEVCLVSALLAGLSWLLVERRALDWKDRRAQRLRASAAPHEAVAS